MRIAYTLFNSTRPSQIKGSAAANILVKQFDEGKNELVKNTLVRNIGQSLYKEKKEMMKMVYRQYPNLKIAKEIEFGFKIRDKTQPDRWYFPEKMVLIPEEDKLPAAPLDNAGEKIKDALGSLGSVLGLGGKEEKKATAPVEKKKGF